MKCKKEDVLTAINELRMGEKIGGTHHLSFKMRKEQVEAVNQTQEYFQSIWQDDNAAAPRFLWNAKMRFGKTFTAYQLAKKILAKRVLVVTFKPAVADSWKSDLESHVDFNGWQFLSRNSKQDPTDFGNNDIVVYFGSFQDLLGKDKVGNIKAKNEWIHKENWDLVIFDEYHFGAWRRTAKELFEGEDNEVAKEEIKIEFASDLKYVNEDLETLSLTKRNFFQFRHGLISTSQAPHFVLLPPVNSSKSRFSIGPTPTSREQNWILRKIIPMILIHMVHYQKCDYLPIECQMKFFQ